MKIGLFAVNIYRDAMFLTTCQCRSTYTHALSRACHLSMNASTTCCSVVPCVCLSGAVIRYCADVQTPMAHRKKDKLK